MPELLELPREVLDRILFYADQETRRNLRLTNQLLGQAGRPWVFHDIHLCTEQSSCEKLRNILDRPDLARHVTKLYLNTMDSEGDTLSCSEDSDNEDQDETSNNKELPVLPWRFWNLLDRLNELPRLQSVVLRFDPECSGGEDDWDDCSQDVAFRSAVMKKFMSSLAALPRTPRELAIRDLQNINETDPEVVANIRKVLEGLKSLRLNITNEHSEGNGELDLEREAPHVFFPELPSFWLQPTVSTLEHLTLYSSNYFGFYPKLDLRDIHFPRLKTLALGNYAFIHDSQLDWILSHGETLTELYLDDCPILFEVAIRDTQRTYLDPAVYEPDADLTDEPRATYYKRWKDYFRALKDGLPHLQHFRSGHCPHWWDDSTTPFERETDIEIGFTEESYMVFCDGYGPSPYMKRMIYTTRHEGVVNWEDRQPLKYTDEDVDALRELLAKTGQPIPEDIECPGSY